MTNLLSARDKCSILLLTKADLNTSLNTVQVAQISLYPVTIIYV